MRHRCAPRSVPIHLLRKLEAQEVMEQLEKYEPDVGMEALDLLAEEWGRKFFEEHDQQKQS